MDGTPQKLTDVTFDERRRGYDPEQVDNYLEKVSQAVEQLQELLRDAVARAEGAEARLAQARRGHADAEKESDRLRAEVLTLEAKLAKAAASGPALDKAPTAPAAAPAAAGVDGDELAKVLLLAQRTADQAVADAKVEGKKVVSDARGEATRLVVDAQRQRDEILRDAKGEAAAMVEKQSAGLHDAVARLEQRRDDLQADLGVLTKYVDEQRRALASAIEKLRRVLEDPTEFRVAAAPVLKTAKPETAGDATPPVAAAKSVSAAKPAATPAPTGQPAATPSPARTPVPPTPSPSTSPPAATTATKQAGPGGDPGPPPQASASAKAPSTPVRSAPSAAGPSSTVTTASPASATLLAEPAASPATRPADPAPATERPAGLATDAGPATERYDVLADGETDAGAAVQDPAPRSDTGTDGSGVAAAAVDDDDALFQEFSGGDHGDEPEDDAMQAFLDGDDGEEPRRWFGRRR